jgi:hypothetical protein
VVDSLTEHYVIRARAFGSTWAEIGAALDLTMQGAQQRYGRAVRDAEERDKPRPSRRRSRPAAGQVS